MPKPAAEMNPCLCGCGELTSGKWRRGHWARGEGGYDPAQHGPPETPLPGPGDVIDLGAIDLDDEAPEELSPAEAEWLSRHGGPAARAAANARPPEPPPAAEEPEGEIPADPAPGPPADRTRAGKRPVAAAVRVTVNMRKDIAAKVGLALTIPGKVWEVRDPYCGGMFVHQLPATTEALVDIICDSPDLVAFFTGPGGAFMKYLKLAIALQPVGQVMYAHHVAHAIDEAAEGQGAPDAAQYAA